MMKPIARCFKSFSGFFAALAHTKKQTPAPDPRKAAARRMRESMHASRAGSTVNNSKTEQIYGKELASGYKRPK